MPATDNAQSANLREQQQDPTHLQLTSVGPFHTTTRRHCYCPSHSLSAAPAWRTHHLEGFTRSSLGYGEQQWLGTKPCHFPNTLQTVPKPTCIPSCSLCSHRDHNPALHTFNRHHGSSAYLNCVPKRTQPGHCATVMQPPLNWHGFCSCYIVTHCHCYCVASCTLEPSCWAPLLGLRSRNCAEGLKVYMASPDLDLLN